MKPLKARGISKETGEMVYGQVIERYGKIYIYDKIKLPEYLGSFIYEDSDEEEIREEEVKLIYAGPKRYLTQIIVQGSEIKPETLIYEDIGNMSDGYHTFNELYDFRRVYNAALFNEWAEQGKYNVLKSKVHEDGEKCFDGDWFIVQATLPSGQISNHYEMKYWDDFMVNEKLPDKFDGHTPKDVLNRIGNIHRNKELLGEE